MVKRKDSEEPAGSWALRNLLRDFNDHDENAAAVQRKSMKPRLTTEHRG
ncbi:MAG: hypothetical protein OJF51_000107 [Nitrospira sp.]|nr:MAG: hypothetical protein OJF51_000107 [Nitrospira sp.]